LRLEEKAIAVYILTGDQTNRIGYFDFSIGKAIEDLETSLQTFQEGFGNVLRRLNWEYDNVNRVFYIPTWWKWNPPENPNVLKGNLKDLLEVAHSPLIEKFKSNTEYLSHSPNLVETFTRTLAERYSKPYRKPPSNQEQEQEQDKNTPSSPPQAGDDSPEISKGRRKGSNGTVPYQEIQASWNQNAPPLLPRVRALDAKRKRLIKAAWQEHPEVSWFEEFFRDIALSDHHSGKNDRNWTPDIGWILNERVRLQEKFESLKQAHAPPEVRYRARDPACPRCGGSGLYKAGQTPDGQPAMRECNCSEVMNGPKQSQARDNLHAPGEP